MFQYSISFASPWYLLLAAGLPLMWWFSYRSLGALGPVRRWVALLLRTAVLLALIFALAEIQMVRSSDRITVVYLLDQSLSIPIDERHMMIEYVNEAISEHRQEDDRVGVIVFGKDAAIEIPPFADDIQMAPLIESLIDDEFTNLAAAMRLAQASFPEGAAKRIVIVTDGNENQGDAIEQATTLADAGVGIDVVPIRYQNRGEVIVERLTIPSDVRRDQPFDLKIITNNTNKPTESDSGEVAARLVLRKWSGGNDPVVVSEEAITLPPGKRVYKVRQKIAEADFYRYEAVLVPENSEDDTMRQNNRATTFTHVRGKGQILIIEDFENRGQYDRLKQALQQHNLEVTVRSSDQLFTGLAELQQFDAVLIANVPHEHFTDAQIDMLVRNTQQLGSGLMMLGAPNSFGAGGWTNTALEKAMPVDFQIKSAKVVPQGALALLMHASEMAQGNYWQKVIAQEALNALGSRDYCGVVHYNNVSPSSWLWKGGMVMVGGRRKAMLAALSRMTPGDMPDFEPGMAMALKGLNAVPGAAVKHMIIISDGDPSPPKQATLNALRKNKITVSTVAVAAHGTIETRLMNRIAIFTKGKFYPVLNPKALPRIFQREARRVAQPLVYEDKNGFPLKINAFHEMINGVEEFPPITGYVMTTRKENPLVEIPLISISKGAEKNRTILAGWTYGLGKSVSFTTDASALYTKQWPHWENYDKLFGQIVRWVMRPVGEEGNFTMSSTFEDGQVKVVVTALDKDDEFINFLSMSASVVDPELKSVGLTMEQTAPGRYVGTFPADGSGSYFVMVNPGGGMAPIRAGLTVPYSDEFRGRPPNEAILGQLAQIVPKRGKPGKMIESTDGTVKGMLGVNAFRRDLPKSTSSQDIWYFVLLVGSCTFFFDVFIRRVQVSFAWVPVLVGRVRDTLLSREVESTEPQTIDRLRSRKAEVTSQMDQMRASTRFEAPADSTADLDHLEEDMTTAAPEPKPEPTTSMTPDVEEDSYTARLLKAKKKAWDERKQD